MSQSAEWPRPIRPLPGVDDRVETGAVQFGDDWPGVFIRGDNAGYLALHLREALKEPNPFSTAIAESIAELLESCNVSARGREWESGQ